jgi:hypothetical protein
MMAVSEYGGGNTMPKQYRVWHTEKKNCSKFDTKEKTEVTATTIRHAKTIVKIMFPTHRISSCWLITK